jgi:hypothetical protein
MMVTGIELKRSRLADWRCYSQNHLPTFCRPQRVELRRDGRPYQVAAAIERADCSIGVVAVTGPHRVVHLEC